MMVELICHCLRCGHDWRSVLGHQPVRCARCRSRWWTRPRVRVLRANDRRLADVRHARLLALPGSRAYVANDAPAPRVTPWRRAKSGW